jgi:hypothetical protein
MATDLPNIGLIELSSYSDCDRLCLSTSVQAQVVRRAKAEGTSFNQFVATAISEKLAAMNTAAFFLGCYEICRLLLAIERRQYVDPSKSLRPIDLSLVVPVTQEFCGERDEPREVCTHRAPAGKDAAATP